MAKADWLDGVLWLPKWAKQESNRPRSPKNVKGWLKQYDRIPECEYKMMWFKQLVNHCADRGWSPPW